MSCSLGCNIIKNTLGTTVNSQNCDIIKKQRHVRIRYDVILLKRTTGTCLNSLCFDTIKRRAVTCVNSL